MKYFILCLLLLVGCTCGSTSGQKVLRPDYVDREKYHISEDGIKQGYLKKDYVLDQWHFYNKDGEKQGTWRRDFAQPDIWVYQERSW